MTRGRRRAVPLVIEQDNATGGVSFWERADNQSAADRNGVSTAYYIHALFGLLRQAGSRRVLMIGCGGGTLATMLERTGADVTLVDVSAASFAIARRYFHLPDSVACHVADGRDFLRRDSGRYDGIVVDAFADRAIPAQFLKSAFFDLAKARLAAGGGVFLMNVLVASDADKAPERIARRMAGVWRHVRFLDAVGWPDRNAIALAGAVQRLAPPTLSMPPLGDTREIAAGLAALDFRRLRG
ncbi:MAG: spermidine synthase [Rhizomicrobium sp.]